MKKWLIALGFILFLTSCGSNAVLPDSNIIIIEETTTVEDINPMMDVVQYNQYHNQIMLKYDSEITSLNEYYAEKKQNQLMDIFKRISPIDYALYQSYNERYLSLQEEYKNDKNLSDLSKKISEIENQLKDGTENTTLKTLYDFYLAQRKALIDSYNKDFKTLSENMTVLLAQLNIASSQNQEEINQLILTINSELDERILEKKKNLYYELAYLNDCYYRGIPYVKED